MSLPNLSATQQLHELLNAQAGIGDNSAKRSRAHSLVVGDNHPRVRLIASQDHVTARLATEQKPRSLKRGAYITAREISGKLRHVCQIRD